MKKFLFSILVIFSYQLTFAQSYGVFTEDASITQRVDIDGGAAKINNVSGLGITISTTDTYEGAKSIKLTHDLVATWAMMQIIASPVIDLSAYADGFYNFAMKTTTTETFNIRITDNVNKPKIIFASGADPYDFKRDGQWHMISIPIKDFKALTPSLNLAAIAELMVVRGPDALTATSNFVIDIDNVYFSKGTNSVDVVSSPTFSPTSGDYTEKVDVTLICSTSDAVIHYTLDGTDPTILSPVYSGAIKLTETKTIKAVAIKNNVSSIISSGTYTIKAPVQATDTYSIYSNDTNIGTGTTIKTVSNNLFVISTISTGTYEGAEALRFSTDLSQTWAMASIQPTVSPLDISAYSTGYYNLALKSTSQGTIEIQLRSSGQKAVISFDATSDKYNFKRDGEWHFISIPIADIKTANANIDLAKLTDILVFRSAGDITLAGNYDFELDHFYLSLTKPVSPVEVVEKPTFTPAGSKFIDSIMVSIATPTTDASIYYSTDGTEPTAKSTLYSNSIKLIKTTTVKAIAIKGDISSSINLATYTLTEPVVGVEAPIFLPVSGEYYDSVQVTITCPTEGAKIYYSTDGTLPSALSKAYSGVFTLYSNSKVQAIAVSNDLTSSITTVNYFVGKSGIINNRTFDNSIQGWTYGTIDPTKNYTAWDSVNHQLTAHIATLGTSYTSFQFYNFPTATAFEVGKSYTLTFDAYGAVQDHNIDISCGYNGGSYLNFISNNDRYVKITKTKSTYTLHFTAPSTFEMTNFRVGFRIGGTTGGNIAQDLYFDNIVLTQDLPAAVEAPVITPASGEFTDLVNASITTKTEGATIYYTIDGTTPTTKSIAYTGSFTLKENAKIKAIAVKNNDVSLISEATYTIKVTPITVDAPLFSAPDGEYTNTLKVSISSATTGAQIYYTKDGSIPTASSLLYSAEIALTSNTVIKAIAIKDGTLSAVSTATYTFKNTNSVESINLNSIKVYPNPTTDYVIASSTESSFANICDINGKIIINQIPTNKQVSVAELQKGIYFVSILNGSKIYRYKFIKQ
jgi:hypothetical protein